MCFKGGNKKTSIYNSSSESGVTVVPSTAVQNVNDVSVS